MKDAESPTPHIRAVGWLQRQPVPVRRERHFGDRVVTCFADRPDTLHAMLHPAMTAAGEADALAGEEGRRSHAELLARAGAAAGGLAALGVSRGDRVALLLGNRFAFVEAWLACLGLGAVLVPINPRWAAGEIAYAVNDAGARVLIHEADLADRLPPAAETPGLLARLPVCDAAPDLPAGPPPDPTPGAEEDCAVILYTSGTTGRPKGAMLTHLNLVHSVMHFRAGMDVRAGDRTLLSVPASHVTGLVANLAALLSVGGCVVMQRAFKARAFLELAAAERITHALMVPAMYNLCLRDPEFDRFDLSAWRLGGYGGAPMPPAVVAALGERLPRLALQQAYGSTETTSPATLMPPEETAARPWSVGLPLHCAEIAVMDDDGREVPAGEPGELWIKGPMVVPGYWGNAEATAKEFVAGFWKSGDIGRMDPDGHVAVLDRKKDMINRGGYKVWSVEVENALMRHPDVVEAAAVAQPCEVLGERVRVHLVLREGVDPAAVQPALEAHAAAELADYKRPDAWAFEAGALPRNPNGKVLKTALRERG